MNTSSLIVAALDIQSKICEYYEAATQKYIYSVATIFDRRLTNQHFLNHQGYKKLNALFEDLTEKVCGEIFKFKCRVDFRKEPFGGLCGYDILPFSLLFLLKLVVNGWDD